MSSELGYDLVIGDPMESENIEAGVLVFQQDGYIYRASNDNEERPCFGIVVGMFDGTHYYHTRRGIFTVAVEGTDEGLGLVYLGADGAVTFEKPTSGYIQNIGYVVSDNNNGTYEVLIDIGSTSEYIT